MSERGFGPVAHVAIAVADVPTAMRSLLPLLPEGTRWSTVRHPVARLRDASGVVTEVEIDYVTTAGDEPRIKLLTAVPGSLFAASGLGPVHHISYWVEDLEAATASRVADGWEIEATGIDDDLEPGYRYLRTPEGRRIEIGWASRRVEFDDWANSAE